MSFLVDADPERCAQILIAFSSTLGIERERTVRDAIVLAIEHYARTPKGNVTSSVSDPLRRLVDALATENRRLVSSKNARDDDAMQSGSTALRKDPEGVAARVEDVAAALAAILRSMPWKDLDLDGVYLGVSLKGAVLDGTSSCRPARGRLQIFSDVQCDSEPV